MTRRHDPARPDSAESAQYLALLERMLDELAPDQLIASDAHPMIAQAMEMARRRGATTVYTVHGLGSRPRALRARRSRLHGSQYVTDAHRAEIGLVSTPIDRPIDWSDVLAPDEDRAFVTFVNPALHKGAALFARLADMLGARRPDIPVLVVQSARGAGWLNALPGMDWRRYPQIKAAPAVARPAEFLALTRMLLVPSVEEAFGRVAAEAMINGIPPVVSNRGGLPDTVGGDFAGWRWAGRAHSRLDDGRRRSRAHRGGGVAVVRRGVRALGRRGPLRRVAARARTIAAERYSEAVFRARHVDYLTSLRPGFRPFES